LIVVCSTLLAVVVLFSANAFLQSQRAEVAQEKALSAARSSVNAVLESIEAQARAVANTLVENRALLSAWSSEDRAATLGILQPVLDRLRRELGLGQIVLQDLDFDIFLRTQFPQQFADNIANLRPGVVSTMAIGEASSGIAWGKLVGLSVRAIVPAFNGDTLLGTVDVGFSFQGDFGEVFKRSFTGVGSTASPSNRTQVKIYARGKGETLDLIISTMENDVPIDRNQLEQSLDTGRIDLNVTHAGTPWRVSLEPMVGIAGDHLAVVAILQDVSEIRDATRREFAIAVLAALLAAVLASTVGLLALRD